MAKNQPKHSWANLRDEEIMQMRIRDLNIKVSGSTIEPSVQRLYQELEAQNIHFHPPCYLADEWLCPDRVPIIGIPFYVAHPRLKRIERKLMFEVEGGTEKSCMKLLRHECGHAMNYAYELYKRTRWRKLFGSFSARYSDSYYFQPYSKRYVMHLRDNYAQAHPDEDFAETFAVWLTPGNNWRQKYKGWPVTKKLQYVDGLMQRICDQPPIKKVEERPPWSASRMTSTLAAYYERKRRSLGTAFQGFYDDNLRLLFSSTCTTTSTAKASELLRRYRCELIDHVTKWTGHRKYDIHQLIRRLITRCDALDLYARSSDIQNIVGLTALITAIANNTLRVVGEQKRK
jgi:hypothetical protein